MKPAPLVITLIHGTYARGASWTREGSPLRNAIAEGLGHPVCFEHWDWSGRNSHSARLDASIGLRKHLIRCAGDHPGSAQVVIAHSHAGNIAMYAFRDPAVCALISGTICLSTPFLNVRRRRLNRGAWIGIQSIIWLFVIVLPFALAAIFGHSPTKDDSVGSGIYFGTGALMIVAYLFLDRAFSRRFPAWEDSGKPLVDYLEDSFSCPPLTDREMLIIRASGDEATALLTTGDFLSYLLERFVRLASPLMSFSSNVYEWLKNSLKATATRFSEMSEILPRVAAATKSRVWEFFARHQQSFMVLCFMIALGSAALWDNAGTIWEKVPLAVMALAAAAPVLVMLVLSFAILIAGAFALAGLALSAAAATPLAAVFLVTWLLLFLPFGAETALVGFALEIHAEATPAGEWTVFQLGDAGLQPGLWHSVSYEHPAALDRIVTWLSQHVSGL